MSKKERWVTPACAVAIALYDEYLQCQAECRQKDVAASSDVIYKQLAAKHNLPVPNLFDKIRRGRQVKKEVLDGKRKFRKTP